MKNESGPKDNNLVTTGPCQPSDYMSPGNGSVVPHGHSILAANVTARLQEKAMQKRYEMGGPYEYQPGIDEVRRRYRTRMYNPGMATYDKSKDDIY